MLRELNIDEMEMVSGGSDPKKKKNPGPWTDNDTINGPSGTNINESGTGHGEGTPIGEHQHGPFGPHGDMGAGEAVQDWLANPGHNVDHTVDNLKTAIKEVSKNIADWYRSHNGNGGGPRTGHPNNPNSYRN